MSEVINRLKYIVDSPPQENGGFHTETVETAKLALDQLASAVETIRHYANEHENLVCDKAAEWLKENGYE